MTTAFPKKALMLKVGDTAICVNESKDNFFLQIGTVKYAAKPPKESAMIFGVEFDKDVKSKEDCKLYFVPKPGRGGMFKINELYKVSTKTFDLAAFKKSLVAATRVSATNTKGIEMQFEEESEQAEEEAPASESTNHTKADEGEVSPIAHDAPAKDVSPPTSTPSPPKPHTSPSPALKPQAPEPPKTAPEPPKPAPVPHKAAPEPPKVAPEPPKVAPEPPRVAPEPPRAPPAPPKAAPEPPKPSSSNVDPEILIKLEQEKIKRELEAEEQSIEIKNLTFQVQDLKQRNAILADQASQKTNELKQLREDYESLKSMSESNNTEQIGQLEEAGKLKVTIANLSSENEALKKKLDEFKDYPVFQKKFEDMSIDYTSLKEEVTHLRKDKKSIEDRFKELSEAYELQELESEVAARTENIPTNPDELRRNYILIQRAFNKVDMDLELIRSDYEERMEEMRKDMQKLRDNYRNVLSSDDVKSALKAKDKQIAQLHELVDQYALANKTAETLTEKLAEKDSEVEAVKYQQGKLLEKMKILEEEAQILDEINTELTSMYEERCSKVDEMKTALAQRDEEKAELVDRLQKYRAKLESVSDEKEILAMQTAKSSTNDAVSELVADLNRTINARQHRTKDRLNLKLKSKDSKWDAMKWKSIAESVPHDMIPSSSLLALDQFKEICSLTDKIEVIIENILEQFITNDSLIVENPNLIFFVRSLLQDLLSFDGYVCLLRKKMLDGEPNIMASSLASEITRCKERINATFLLFSNNDVSASYAYSEIGEALTKLRSAVEDLTVEDPRLILRAAIGKMISKFSQEWASPDKDSATRSNLASLLPKLYTVWERLFDYSVDSKVSAKAEGLVGGMPSNFVDVKNFCDSVLRDLESVDSEFETSAWNVETSWKKDLKVLKEDLLAVDGLKASLVDKETQISKLEAEKAEKIAELEKATVAKMNMESKLFKSQGIINEVSTLKMENEGLRKNNEALQRDVKAAQEKAEAVKLDVDTTREKEILRQNAVGKVQEAARRTMIRHSVVQNIVNPIVEEQRPYNNHLVRFEVTSLNAIVNNIIGELNGFRAKELVKRLQDVNRNTPALDDLMRLEQKKTIMDKSVTSFVSDLRKNRSMIKKEIAQIKVIDLKDPSKIGHQLRESQTSKNKREALLWESKKSLSRLSELDEEYLLGYNIDLNKEFGAEINIKPPRIFAKLQLIDSPPIIANPPEERVLTASLEIR